MVQEFIKLLNKKSSKQYRLPTEAEWEYAAREGGKKRRFGNGKDIADPAEMNFYSLKDYKQPYSVVGEYRKKTTPVDFFRPNALGLYDMSGNVWEWCSDWYAEHYYREYEKQDIVRNPQGPETGSSRVIRGGGWVINPQSCRSTYRDASAPDEAGSDLGFRLVLSFLPDSR